MKVRCLEPPTAAAAVRAWKGPSSIDLALPKTSEDLPRRRYNHGGDPSMCLAAPARVVSVSEKTAVVDYDGVRTTARLDTLSDPVEVGDYVLVHTGFAIRRLTAEDAEETLRLFDELARSLSDRPVDGEVDREDASESGQGP
jgi:hydrogenase expression/formation protein HypC